MIGADLEQLLRRLIREEIGRALSGDAAGPGDDAAAADDAELQQLAVERAAKLRRTRGAR